LNTKHNGDAETYDLLFYFNSCVLKVRSQQYVTFQSRRAADRIWNPSLCQNWYCYSSARPLVITMPVTSASSRCRHSNGLVTQRLP